MKIEIENLKAYMRGVMLTPYQKGDALSEFNNLLYYVEELEKSSINAVVQQRELLIDFYSKQRGGMNDTNKDAIFREVDNYLSK
jgi:hypothetical protein